MPPSLLPTIEPLIFPNQKVLFYRNLIPISSFIAENLISGCMNDESNTSGSTIRCRSGKLKLWILIHLDRLWTKTNVPCKMHQPSMEHNVSLQIVENIQYRQMPIIQIDAIVSIYSGYIIKIYQKYQRNWKHWRRFRSYSII